MWDDYNAEAAAEMTLNVTWRDQSDWGLPIDPILIAGDLGVQVYTANLDGDVSGMLVKHAELDPVIYLQAKDSSNRQRFTCAHELGHHYRLSNGLVPGHTSTGDWEYVEHRSLLAREGTDTEEIFANRFAAALLMPRDLVRERPDRPVSVLAAEFGVSIDAMGYRLANLGER